MRLLLFTGKGGVGTTTAAVATAIHAARCGVKSRLLCLGSTREQPELPASAEVPAAAEVPTSAEMLGAFDALGVDRLTGDDVTVLPGIDELLALAQWAEAFNHCAADLLVVDAGPIRQLIRLLAAPEALIHYGELLLPAERRVERALAAAAAPDGTARDQLGELHDRLRVQLDGVRAVLTGPSTSLRLVVTPDRNALAQARHGWTALALHGYAVDAVVINRILPGSGSADPWLRRKVGEQAERLREVGATFTPLTVLRLAETATEPVTDDDHAALGSQLYPEGGEQVLAAGRIRPPIRVEPRGSGFTLEFDLPPADRDAVTLWRQGDHLELDVEGERRVMPLPSALRRCQIEQARWRAGTLQICFEPDPDLWPKA